MSMPVPSRALLEKYATSAPRYTSYPTAVDWDQGFDPTRYPALLEQAGAADGPLSVYVHLPYCAELCLFCGCNMVVSRSEARMDAYLEQLEREFAFAGARGLRRRPVRQYHWGGGTPTQFSLEQMQRVQAAFRGAFTLADDAEIGIEVDPRVTSTEQVRWLAQAGWNRISLGVQDFDVKVQTAVKRHQSEEQTRAVVDAARAAGIPSVNIDLMYGLPEQTFAGFEATVERVLDIRPERVALFHYAHVPWMKKHQSAMDLESAPEPADKLAIFTRAIEQFRRAGYVYIGLDHFALPGDELAVAQREGWLGRNFMGYTTRRGDDMVSFGMSSIGEVAGCFAQSAHTEGEYLERMRTHGHAIHRGHELSAEDRLRRDVILSLMCNCVLDKARIERAHGIGFDATFARELAELAPLAADGLCRLEPGAIRVTELGQLFLRNVALPFDRYFRARRARGTDTRQTFSKTL